jgi:hypothetical protein
LQFLKAFLQISTTLFSPILEGISIKRFSFLAPLIFIPFNLCEGTTDYAKPQEEFGKKKDGCYMHRLFWILV